MHEHPLRDDRSVRDPTSSDPDNPPFDFADAVGGPLGMLEASLPAAAFILAYALSGSETGLSAVVAVALAGALAIGRLALRQSPRHAVSGLAGIALAAFVAARSGRAENFYLPGLLTNAGYAAAFLISILVRRPLVGVILGQLDRNERGWRSDPARVRAFDRASWLWIGLFTLRLAVELPLYLAGAVLALGIARTALGLPLFALGLWATWLLVRSRRET